MCSATRASFSEAEPDLPGQTVALAKAHVSSSVGRVFTPRVLLLLRHTCSKIATSDRAERRDVVIMSLIYAPMLLRGSTTLAAEWTSETQPTQPPPGVETTQGGQWCFDGKRPSGSTRSAHDNPRHHGRRRSAAAAMAAARTPALVCLLPSFPPQTQRGSLLHPRSRSRRAHAPSRFTDRSKTGCHRAQQDLLMPTAPPVRPPKNTRAVDDQHTWSLGTQV